MKILTEMKCFIMKLWDKIKGHIKTINGDKLGE